MKIYFIRHGQSENNALYTQTGSSIGRKADPRLTSLGKNQARLLSRHLSKKQKFNGNIEWDEYQITRIYTSLMLRAVETASHLAKELRVKFYGRLDLHEWGGMYLDDPETGQPCGLPGSDKNYFESNFDNLILPEGVTGLGWWNRPYETRDETKIRAKKLVRDILEIHAGENAGIVLISHGGFYNNFLAALMNEFGKDFSFQEENGVWFALNNTGVSRFDIEGDTISVIYHNRVDFLEPDQVT